MAEPFRVGFCVSGGGRLMQAAVLHARTIGIEPTLVVLDDGADATLEQFCAQHDVLCHRLGQQPRAELDQHLFELTTSARLRLLSLTFDRILSAPLIARFAGNVVNVHPALLPAFAGMNALDQAAAHGVRFAGATIHEANDVVDGGAIIAQCVVGVRRDDTAADVGVRVYPLLRRMYLQVLAWHSAGRVERDDAGRIWVRDAVYGELPISPAVELAVPD